MLNSDKNTYQVVLNKVFLTEESLDIYQICPSAFTKIKFQNCTFQDVLYLGNILSSCNFQNCIFNNATFNDRRFQNCDFENCLFKDSNLTSTEFEDSSFKNCQFTNVSLQFSEFLKCKFKEIQIKDNDLRFISSEQVKFYTPTSWIEITHEMTLDFEQLLQIIQQLTQYDSVNNTYTIEL